MTQYNLYHYRGTLIGSFGTPQEAQAAKDAQKNPSEYYWEQGDTEVELLAEPDRK